MSWIDLMLASFQSDLKYANVQQSFLFALDNVMSGYSNHKVKVNQYGIILIFK